MERRSLTLLLITADKKIREKFAQAIWQPNTQKLNFRPFISEAVLLISLIYLGLRVQNDPMRLTDHRQFTGMAPKMEYQPQVNRHHGRIQSVQEYHRRKFPSKMGTDSRDVARKYDHQKQRAFAVRQTRLPTFGDGKGPGAAKAYQHKGFEKIYPHGCAPYLVNRADHFVTLSAIHLPARPL